MDEEQKRLIRIDPQKVQQKIFELYPANSSVRRTAISEAKAREIEHLSHSMSSIPIQVAKSTIDQNKKLILIAALIGTLFLVGGIGALTYAFFFHKTLVELFLAAFLGGQLIAHAIKYIKDIFHLRRVTSSFLESLEKVQKRIEELRN